MKIPSPSLAVKTVRCFAFLFILFLPIFITACKSESVVEPEPEARYGLAGRITDSSGVALDSVSIYCYYRVYPGYTAFSQNEVNITKRLKKTTGFDFSLSRNFPNPVYKSTYIQFGLPAKSHIEFSITRKGSSKASYFYSGDFSTGLYQHYLEGIVDSQKLINGPYTINFSARTDSGLQFNARNSMFVASDRGNPNVITNSSGEYYFPFSEAFVGDTLTYMSNADMTSYSWFTLGNNMYFYIKRRGYRSLVFSTSLFRNLLLHQDIVLFKEDENL